MSDFTYDNEDSSAIRVATKDLARNEHMSSIASLAAGLTFVGYHYLTKNSSTSAWSKSPNLVLLSALVGASFGYF